VRSCDVLQHALFAQQPIWQAFGLGVVAKMHVGAGNRIAAVKSASPTAMDTVILLIIALPNSTIRAVGRVEGSVTLTCSFSFGNLPFVLNRQIADLPANKH
jgi:hypothetical protein